MFRRNRMLRNLFGSPCEKAETRRRKPTVKPHLEELTDRILPSASSLSVVSVSSPLPVPPVAAATTNLASTMDQLGHLIATLEQNVIGAYQALGQEIAQEDSYVLYQLDHLFGIMPNSPNQSLGTAAQQTGRGSGSGSGAMTTAHEESNAQPISQSSQKQPLNLKTQLAGSGSGTDSGGQSFIWEPVSGGDYLWSDPNNWSNHVAPQNGAPAYFTGTYNSQCIVDTNTTQGTISLENGFTAPIEIEDGDTLNIPGFDDLDISGDLFNVNFLGANANLNFKAGQDQVMGNFNWQAGGKVTVNGANLVIGQGPGLNQSTASPLIINSGSVSIGTSSSAGGVAGSSTFKLTNGSADINVNPGGILEIYAPSFQDTKMVDNTGTSAWISNNGTTELFAFGGWTGIIASPFENHGVLSAGGGNWKFTSADANGDDLSMDTGEISMGNSVYLNLTHDYMQTGGTLKIDDTTAGNLYASGAANFIGGKIVFDSPTGFGRFYVGNVVFNGVEIDMRIDPGSTTSDQISCLMGNLCTIQGNSKLVVTAAQAVNKGITWTLIKPNTGNKITGDFLPANITLPNGVTEKVGALPNSWQCNS